VFTGIPMHKLPASLGATAGSGLAMALFAAFPPTAILAQSAPPLAVPGWSPIRATELSPLGEHGGTWASGINFKVRFDGGMTFYPHVGASLPHQPLQWRTVSVRAGTTELLTEVAAGMRHDDRRCEYDLGAVVERYDVRSEGVEQSFVIHRRPAPGDLVVRGRVTTPLQWRPSPTDDAAFTLHLADGREVMRYGTAVAIDATGRRTGVSVELDGDVVALRVAAGFVADATFPLVVDPLWTSTLLRSGAPIDDVDVLHETVSAAGSQGRLWIAESRTVAAGDSDVRVYRHGTGFGGGTEVYREISLWDSTHPALAFAASAQRAVVVHSTDFGAQRILVVHRHATVDLSLSTAGDVVPIAGNECHWRPDVGGRRNQAGNRVLITFQREAVAPFAETATSQVWACVYEPGNTLAPFVVAPFAVDPQSNRDQERPVVNQAAATNDWLVACQEHNANLVNDDWDIEVFAVDGAGVVSGDVVTTADAGQVGLHKVGPQLAGGNGRYVLTYATRSFDQLNPKPTSPEGQTVWSQRIDWNHTTNDGSRPWPAAVLFDPGTVTVRATGIAFDPVSEDHWCASLRNDVAAAYRVLKLGYTGEVVEWAALPTGAGSSPRALDATFNQESRDFPIVYVANDGTGTGNDLLGTRLQYDPVAPPALLGVACGAGTWANVAGIGAKQQIGAENLPLQLGNAPADTFALLFLSTNALPLDGGLFGAPGCTLHPDLQAPFYLGAIGLGIVGGAASTTLDLPPALAPTTLTMQWAYLVPGANPLEMQASEGLTVQLGR
jgi:hypothetical protein